MSWLKWCKEELEKAGYFDSKKDFYGGLTGKSVFELCEVFDKQNHSGLSASVVGPIFKRLVDGLPLTPLTGEDDEWIEHPDGSFQNRRYGAVFKKNGIAYDHNARVFSDEKGRSYTSAASRKKVEFPYMPEPEHVGMSEMEWALKTYMPYVGKKVTILTFRGEKFEGVFGLSANPSFVEVQLYNDDSHITGFPVAEIAEIKIIKEDEDD